MLSNGRTRGRGRRFLASSTWVSAYNGSNIGPENVNFSAAVGAFVGEVADDDEDDEEDDEEEEEDVVSSNDTLYFLARKVNKASWRE